jgi:hypothetical protein
MENFLQEGGPWLHVCRRLTGPKALLDFPILTESAAAGASDYFAVFTASIVSALIGVAVLWNAPTQETADGA